MCGITIFLSKNDKNIVKDIIKSLYQIQNRGYDSVGIGIRFEEPTKKHNWNIYKYASLNCDSLDKLSDVVNNMSSVMAIGHTRWATHGGKTDINSHPHTSMKNEIILVHNGIISNFQEIKTDLEREGYKFYSETDTEVIANLIEFYLLTSNASIIDLFSGK